MHVDNSQSSGNDILFLIFGLENKNFMNSAPANVIENEKKKLQDMTAEFELVKANLEMLQ